MTFLVSLNFMMRSTSSIGWIPLLSYKIVYHGMFKSFVKAGFYVALPTIAFCILADSLYFGQLTLT